MFEFAWPWAVLLLPLPWLVRRLWPASPRALERAGAGRPPQLLHPGIQRLESAYAAATPALPPSLWLQRLLLWLIWAALVATMMRPQWLEKYSEVMSTGHDLMLAVDASRSMEALDFTVDGRRVNRMAVVKGVVGRFIEQRHGDRIGLILFGDGAYVQAPLTLDGGVVRTLLDNSVPRMAGDATAIGDAIGLAVKKLRERPPGSRILILLTDGENTAGSLPPEEAAQLARHYGVRVYTIGVGSKGEVPFPEGGRIVMTDMQIDEDLLRKVAAITGGAYFRATDTQALEGIYRRIDEMEQTEAESQSVMIPTPLYRWPLGVAMLGLLLMAGMFLSGARRGL